MFTFISWGGVNDVTILDSVWSKGSNDFKMIFSSVNSGNLTTNFGHSALNIKRRKYFSSDII